MFDDISLVRTEHS